MKKRQFLACSIANVVEHAVK